MKSGMRFAFLLLIVGPTAMTSSQDLSAADVVRIARNYAVALGHDPTGNGTAHLEDWSKVGGRSGGFWDVSFDDASVMLDRAGLLEQYGWGGTYDPKKLSPGDPFVDDEAAWEFAEDALAPFGVPDGLYRDSIRREPEQDLRAATVSLFFEVRPNGYPTNGGDCAHLTVRNRDRKIISVGISRGWKYEKPNIKVTEAQAIVIAANHTKSSREGWRTSLRYTIGSRPDAPEPMRQLSEQRTFRLCYNVFSNRGNVVVDSVTGDVVAFMVPASSATHSPAATSKRPSASVEKVPVPSKIYAHPKYKPIPPQRSTPSEPTSPELVSRDSAPEDAHLPLIGGVVAGTVVLGFVLLRRR